MRRATPAGWSTLLPFLLAGCPAPNPESATWIDAGPVAVGLTTTLADPALTESSGVAASRAHPGLLWTHNDAGHGPELYATDSTGRALGRWTVTGAASVDWEDIALGPCPAGTCLVIGDVGDNREGRTSVTLYRFPEPDPTVPGGGTAPVEALVIRYPDRPRDVEALMADPGGGIWLLSKGRSDGIFLYHVPAGAWTAGQVTALAVGALPIPHDLAFGHAVTGAALTPDGRRAVVRTYRDLYFFSRTADGTLTPLPGPNRCDIGGLEAQGEAVDWWDDSTLVLTSEGGAGMRGRVTLVRCAGVRG